MKTCIHFVPNTCYFEYWVVNMNDNSKRKKELMLKWMKKKIGIHHWKKNSGMTKVRRICKTLFHLPFLFFLPSLTDSWEDNGTSFRVFYLAVRFTTNMFFFFYYAIIYIYVNVFFACFYLQEEFVGDSHVLPDRSQIRQRTWLPTTTVFAVVIVTAQCVILIDDHNIKAWIL